MNRQADLLITVHGDQPLLHPFSWHTPQKNSFFADIEDDASIRELVCAGLDDEGIAVVTATTNIDALTALITTRFGLILIDTAGGSWASGVDRWADLDRLRSIAGSTPTIIFTAHPPHAFNDYAEHGCIGLISKPFDIDEFTATVCGMLTRTSTTATLQLT